VIDINAFGSMQSMAAVNKKKKNKKGEAAGYRGCYSW